MYDNLVLFTPTSLTRFRLHWSLLEMEPNNISISEQSLAHDNFIYSKCPYVLLSLLLFFCNYKNKHTIVARGSIKWWLRLTSAAPDLPHPEDMLTIIPCFRGSIRGMKWRSTFTTPLTFVSITLSKSSAETSQILLFLLMVPALLTETCILLTSKTTKEKLQWKMMPNNILNNYRTWRSCNHLN